MSDTSQTPVPEAAVDISDPEICLPKLVPSDGPSATAASSRLQTIHDLVRAGEYNIPATLIAERMIERMITHKRGSRH